MRGSFGGTKEACAVRDRDQAEAHRVERQPTGLRVEATHGHGTRAVRPDQHKRGDPHRVGQPDDGRPQRKQQQGPGNRSCAGTARGRCPARPRPGRSPRFPSTGRDRYPELRGTDDEVGRAADDISGDDPEQESNRPERPLAERHPESTAVACRRDRPRCRRRARQAAPLPASARAPPRSRAGAGPHSRAARSRVPRPPRRSTNPRCTLPSRSGPLRTFDRQRSKDGERPEVAEQISPPPPSGFDFVARRRVSSGPLAAVRRGRATRPPQWRSPGEGCDPLSRAVGPTTDPGGRSYSVLNRVVKTTNSAPSKTHEQGPAPERQRSSDPDRGAWLQRKGQGLDLRSNR